MSSAVILNTLSAATLRNCLNSSNIFISKSSLLRKRSYSLIIAIGVVYGWAQLYVIYVPPILKLYGLKPTAFINSAVSLSSSSSPVVKPAWANAVAATNINEPTVAWDIDFTYSCFAISISSFDALSLSNIDLNFLPFCIASIAPTGL